MNTPVEANELKILAQMRAGVSQYHQIKLRSASVRVRPLSVSEVLECTAEAQLRIEQSPKNAQNRISEELILCKIKLERASTSDIGKTDPMMTEYILDRMTVHEILALFHAYNEWLDSIDPDVSEIGMDRLQELAEAVKKNPSTLTELSRWELLNLARSLLLSGG